MNGCSKILVGSTSLFGVLALVFVILYATKGTPDEPEYPSGDVVASARILSWMDQSADPCNDFYQYSCGGWLANTELPASAGRYSTFDDAETAMNKVLKKELSKPKAAGEASSIGKAKDFYAECLDRETIDANGFSQLQSLVNAMGGWPMADGSDVSQYDDSNKGLAKKFYEFATNFAIMPVFGASVDVDKDDVQLHIPAADQPGFLLGSSNYYVANDDSEDNQKLKSEYIDFISTITMLYCEDSGLTCDEATIKSHATEVYDFENTLASIVVDPTTRSSDEEATWSPKTLGEFKNNYTNVGEIVHEMYNLMFDASKVTDDLKMNDASPPFFKAFESWITDSLQNNDETLRQMQNYMVLRSVNDLLFAMPEKYLLAEDKLNAERFGISERSPRESSCINLSNNQLPFPVGAMYVAEAFTQETRDLVFKMIENIIESFETIILDQQNDWMDEETKAKAHNKAKAVKSYVGYPDYIIDDQDQMDEDYSDFTVTPGQLLTALAQIRSKKVLEDFKMFDEPTDRDRWGGKVAWVNAFYSPTRNTITIPAGILQDPFLYSDSSTAMNYGGIGMVIGHELTHGFDDSGALYDEIGNKNNWWSEDSLEKFKIRADKLAAQYSNYHWDMAGPYETNNLNGKFENGENIADNGGIRETFYAYQEWANNNDDKHLPGLEHITPSQQIFLGYAQVWCAKYTEAEAKRRVKTDVHAPGPFRVLGPLSNFDEFSTAFKCSQGDMYFPPNQNQTERVRVW